MEKYSRMPSDVSIMSGPFDSVGCASATGWPILTRRCRSALTRARVAMSLPGMAGDLRLMHRIALSPCISRFCRAMALFARELRARSPCQMWSGAFGDSNGVCPATTTDWPILTRQLRMTFPGQRGWRRAHAQDHPATPASCVVFRTSGRKRLNS